MFNDTATDSEKISLLSTMCNTEAAEVIYRFMETDNYELVKQKVIEYTQVKEERKRRIRTGGNVDHVENEDEEEQWDVDTLMQKGKGKQSKGKGKGLNRNACARCGKLGHWASECKEHTMGLVP